MHFLVLKYQKIGALVPIFQLVLKPQLEQFSYPHLYPNNTKPLYTHEKLSISNKQHDDTRTATSSILRY